MNVQSESDPERTYTVQVHGGQAACNCKGYETHGHCKHTEQALREASESQAVTIANPEEPSEQPPRALVLQPPLSILPSRDELSVMGQIARTLVGASGHAIPKTIDSAAKAAAVMLAGWEMGLKPMTAFRHIFVVNGRTEPDAQAMMGMVKAKDPTAEFHFGEYDDNACQVTLYRRGQKVVTVTYTQQMAEASGQMKTREGGSKDTWLHFRRDMLAWAAIKRACRLGAPDLINAIPITVGDAAALIGEEDTPFVAEQDETMPSSKLREKVIVPEGVKPLSTEAPEWVERIEAEQPRQLFDDVDYLRAQRTQEES